MWWTTVEKVRNSPTKSDSFKNEPLRENKIHAKINISKLFWVFIMFGYVFERSKYLKGLGQDTLTGLTAFDFGIEHFGTQNAKKKINIIQYTA